MESEASPTALVTLPHSPVPLPDEATTVPPFAAAAEAEPVAHEGPAPGGAPSVGRDVARGVLWTAAAKWGSQLVAWASTIIVARILTPSDYGIVAMAGIFTELVSYVCELGIGQGILVHRELEPAQIRQLNTLAVLLGVGGALLTILLALTIAGPLLGNPKLPGVLLVLSPMFVATSFRTVPAALLQRDLRFGRLAVYDTAQAFILAASALTLATMGAGYWTLVVSMLIASTLSAIGVVSARPTGFARPRLAGLGAVLRLSRNVLASRLMWYTYARADTFIVGRVLGSVALGSYSLAWTVANVPVDKASAVLSQVVPGVFAAVSRDRRTLGQYFLGFTEAVALLLAPPCIGLALTAPVFVQAILGARWATMATPLSVLAVFAATRALMPLVSQALITSGQSGRDTLYNLLLLLVFPPALWFAAPHGLLWVARAWLIVLPPLFMWQIGMAVRAVGRTRLEYLRALLPAFEACVLVAAAVLGSKFLLPAGASARLQLAIAALAGAAVYVAFVLLRHGARLRALRDLTRARPAAPAPAAA